MAISEATLSTSTSGKMIAALFPPLRNMSDGTANLLETSVAYNSRVTRLRVFAAACATFLPDTVEPVKDIL